MGNYAALVTIVLLAWTTAQAWPAAQAPNGQAASGPSWPWAAGEGEKAFEMPKSFAYPIPGPQMTDGNEGHGPKWNSQWYPQQQQQKANLLFQGVGSDPWSAFQTNNPFGAGDPFGYGTQETFEANFNTMNTMNTNGNEDFPYTRPYRTLFPQTQYPQQPPPRPMMPDSMYPQEPPPPYGGSPSGPGSPPPPPRAPMMGGGQPQMPPPPPPPHRHNTFGHMMGQNRPFDWTRITGRSNSPEMAPPSSPFDFLTPRYPVEYSPSKLPNGSVPAITVQYNVTYTFSPWGWKTVDVSVSNATFHSATSEKAAEILGAPAGGIIPQQEMSKAPDMSMTSGWWWWPKKTGSEVDGKTPNGPGNEPPSFGEGSAMPHPSPPQ